MDIKIDEVVVDKELWSKVVLGDRDSVLKLRSNLSDMYLYDHILSSYFNKAYHPDYYGGKYMIVTLRNLQECGVIGFVKIDHTDWNFSIT